MRSPLLLSKNHALLVNLSESCMFYILQQCHQMKQLYEVGGIEFVWAAEDLHWSGQ